MEDIEYYYIIKIVPINKDGSVIGDLNDLVEISKPSNAVIFIMVYDRAQMIEDGKQSIRIKYGSVCATDGNNIYKLHGVYDDDDIGIFFDEKSMVDLSHPIIIDSKSKSILESEIKEFLDDYMNEK